MVKVVLVAVVVVVGGPFPLGPVGPFSAKHWTIIYTIVCASLSYMMHNIDGRYTLFVQAILA